MNDGGSMWFGGGGMWIFWIVLFVILVWVIKSVSDKDSGNNSTNESPLEILKKRYARGEIDESEYERRRKELEND